MIRGLGAALGTTATRREHVLLLLVGSSLAINHYDLAIFALALPQIQASLAIGEEQLGAYTSLLRLGVLLALPLAFLADRVGRRRMLLFTLAGMTLATLGSAFAEGKWQFFWLQMLVRCFAYAEEMLCFVIVAEEVAAERRGWAFGWLAAQGAGGVGLAAVLFGTMTESPQAWRTFYLVGAAGLLVVLLARGGLRETPRFEAMRVPRAGKPAWAEHLAPVLALARAYPGRFWAMAGSTAAFVFAMAPATGLLSKYLQDERQFSPAQVALVYLLGGTVSVGGNLLAGPLSDRFGRHRVLAVALLAAPALLALLYLAHAPWLIVAAWSAGLFAFFAADVMLNGVGAEIFPTSYRSTASGARTVIAVLAGMAGLAAESFVYGLVGSHSTAIAWLMLVGPLAIVPLWLAVPETATRELEDIAPEVA